MSYLSVDLVKAYAGPYKSEEIETIDAELEASAVSLVFGHLAGLHSMRKWLNYETTPPIIRKIIVMYYVGRWYQQSYAQDVGSSDYGTELLREANDLIEKIKNGTVVILDDDMNLVSVDIGGPGYLVTDPVFTMDMVF